MMTLHDSYSDKVQPQGLATLEFVPLEQFSDEMMVALAISLPMKLITKVSEMMM